MDKILVPPKGVTMSLLDPETGEVVASFPLSAGVHDTKQIQQYEASGFVVDLPETVSVFRLPSRVRIIRGPDALASSANPDWRPSQANQMAVMFEHMLKRREARADAKYQRQVATLRAEMNANHAEREKAAKDAAAAKAEAEKLVE